ncbi:MAG: hypothetical protein KBD12_00260 [Candidatus Pacebacteria bacterium]|nr:hypothetical protein [Candidatus Paceibacterota bacterium]
METLKTKKSKDIIMCVVLVLISFFIGRWSVGKNSTPSQNFQKGNSSQARMKVENFGGMIRGVIGSVDDQGLVIKDQDGTSKIILLSSSTTISKSTTMISSDLVDGLNVMIRGKANTDGSVLAESIQIFTDQNFEFKPKN